jgi:cell fate regulator YaaT (PSP1 superfamily)
VSERNLEVPIQEYMEVEFRTGRLGYYQNTQNLPIAPEDLIIVEVERGEDIAQVTHLSVSGDEIGAQLPQTGRVYRIRRVATELDLEKLRSLPLEEEKAAQTYADILSRYSFEMKLIETIYQFDGNKLTFFFTAEGRIDFRVLRA